MTEPSADVVALWYHYEEIAMHFNSLIIRYRLQVMAGAGALGTAASYLINRDKTDEPRQDWLRAVLSSGLWVLILSAAILDLAYYNQLLRGAVKALLELERQHPNIQISTRIEETVGLGKYAVWVLEQSPVL